MASIKATEEQIATLRQQFSAPDTSKCSEEVQEYILNLETQLVELANLRERLHGKIAELYARLNDAE